MNTTQLECFLAVAETLNFSKAASLVNISQPAVSHQISSLEAELGVRLFMRTNKNVQLTKEGLRFLPDAELIVKTAADSVHRLGAASNDKKQSIGIGAHNKYELDAIVPVLRAMNEKYPLFEPDITIMPFKSLDNLLEENKLQIILAIKGNDERPKEECFTELCKCPIKLICPSDSELAHKKSVTMADIGGKRLVLIKRHKCAEAATAVYMQLGMPNSSDVIVADNCETAFAIVKAGLGVTVYPVLPYMNEKGLSYIDIEGVSPVSYGLYSKKFVKGELACEFVNTAKKVFQSIDDFEE